jgi:hypothetical protein
MRSIGTLAIEYVSCGHLSQLYEGLIRLAVRNYIALRFIHRKDSDGLKPIVNATLRMTRGREVRIVYDTLDGFNWLDGETESENLRYFRDAFKADFYFKRSLNKRLLEYSPDKCTVLPLGLNTEFPVSEQPAFGRQTKSSSVWQVFKRLISSSGGSGGSETAVEFAFPPIRHAQSKVLLLTRLWDPEGVPAGPVRDERIRMNEFRIQCVQQVRRDFGSHCTAGLSEDDLSRRLAPDLVFDYRTTNRESFCRMTKQHDICVATAGLHGSIGWRFAEFVMASRAIISEPLVYEPAGNLLEGVNYLCFRTPSEISELSDRLLSNPTSMEEMMRRNLEYSLSYIYPEQHALQTLLTVLAFTRG